jgi:hypothetical protein
MRVNRFRIKAAQRRRVAEVVKKEPRLLRHLIERKRFDAQSGFLRRAMTGSFGGAQFWDRS